MKQRLHPVEILLMLTAALLLTSGAVALHTQSELADKVVRLHVLANSDSEEDQALKLEVRDAVLAQASETLQGITGREEACRRLTALLPELEKTAREVIAANGYAYGVRVELAETSFPTKTYDGFALPAGEYLALRVLIGEAAGQNWWCVVFPPLCTALFSKIAMNGMGIFNLLAARFLMAFVLLAVVFFKRLRHIKRHTLVRGAIMGALFFLMLSTELTGLKSTPSSTVSLLENTAIILVPMAEAVLRHKLPKAATAVSALVAIGGVALLTGQSGSFTPGMVLAVMAAVLYAAAIITTDRFSHEDDPLTLGIVQVGTLGLLALVSSFVFEAPHLPQSGTQWLMIAGLAVICTGFGFTLQPVAQSHTTAQRAGLFCALSPACATLLGAAVLREHISVMGMCGIALILLSLLVPQLWQLAEKKGITLLPRHAVPAVRRA